MENISNQAVLIVIDVQQGFDEACWGLRNNPQAEQNIARLLKTWRETSRPIIHVQHLSTNAGSPLHPASKGSRIKEIVASLENETLIQKKVNSAFIGTDLEKILRRKNYTDLIITGLTTPHCVSTTTRMAGNLGFRASVVSDATAAFEIVSFDGKHYSADEIHNISLATLHEEFAKITDTEVLISSAYKSSV